MKSRLKILLFANVGQVPFNNNLLPPVRAFQKVALTRIVEPWLVRGFVPTGAFKPAEIPESAFRDLLTDFHPNIVVCLGGALFLSERSRRQFPEGTRFAGFALSDPLGLEASLEIAPQFDFFYTQDPQTLPFYRARGLRVRICQLAVDPGLIHPRQLPPEYDIIFYGKWTPYRNEMLSGLAAVFRVQLHSYTGETRWSTVARPPLNSPEELGRAISLSRLAVEFAVLDDAPPPFTNSWRMTYRPHFAAACAVPCLIEDSERLADYYEPDVEIPTFTSRDHLIDRARWLLSDEGRRKQMGERAYRRLLRDHIWERRVESFLKDVDSARS